MKLECAGEVLGADISVGSHGKLKGTVLDKDTGEPLQDARVSVSFGLGVTGPFKSGDFGGGRTDDKGRYAVARIPGEANRISFRKKDYQPVARDAADAGEGDVDLGEVSLEKR